MSHRPAIIKGVYLIVGRVCLFSIQRFLCPVFTTVSTFELSQTW